MHLGAYIKKQAAQGSVSLVNLSKQISAYEHKRQEFGIRVILVSVEIRIAFTDHVSEALVTCTYSPVAEKCCPISDFQDMLIIGKQILSNDICAISKFEVKKCSQ